MQKDKLSQLLDKLKTGEITDEEFILLEDWYLQWQPEKLHLLDFEIDEIKAEIWQKIKPIKQDKILQLSLWRKLMVASIFVGTLVLCTYLIQQNYFSKKSATIEVATNNFIKPGSKQATITLADGRKIKLTKGLIGNLANEGNANIYITPGESVAYSNSSTQNKPVAFNTLTTAKGEQSPYPLVLSDGTKVWLNAESSLYFPTNFSGKDRKVKLTGEGYFEVAHNAKKPFIVDVAGKGEVKVLGTRFNVNAYADEPTINTTLLEGSVKFSLPSPGGESLGVRLKPGQQVKLTKGGKLSVNNSVNIEAVMAWKNDKFIFDNIDLETIMRQLERWYDVTVDYKNGLPKDEFVGIISRNVKISEILKMLETTATVQFEIKGQTIIVK